RVVSAPAAVATTTPVQVGPPTNPSSIGIAPARSAPAAPARASSLDACSPANASANASSLGIVHLYQIGVARLTRPMPVVREHLRTTRALPLTQIPKRHH